MPVRHSDPFKLSGVQTIDPFAAVKHSDPFKLSGVQTIDPFESQRIDRDLERAARAADAELRTRGKRLMVPLDAEETALILKHLRVKAQVEAAYARYAMVKRFEPAQIKRRTQQEVDALIGSPPGAWDCHTFTGDNGPVKCCRLDDPLGKATWYCSGS
jgi:hypothetical protein